jgi:O-antigen/teichoic acid export membrane protein
VRPSFVLRGIGQHLRFGGAWSGARFAWQLTSQADVLIGGRVLGQEALGVYSVAVQLANLPLQKVMGIVNQVAFPAIAKLQEELPRMRRRMLEAVRLASFGAVPLLWGISAVAPEFVEVALGEKWQRVMLPLQLIALVAPLRMLASVFATAVSALGRSDVELVNTLVSLVISVAAFLIGVQYEVEGLAVAYFIAVSLSFVLNFPRTARIIGISLSEIGSAGRSSVVGGAVMLASVAGARFALDGLSHGLRLPVLIGVGGVAFLGTLWVLDRAIWDDARKVVIALREKP